MLWQVKKDTVQKWYYEDGDEFNSYSLNTDKWKYGMPWGKVVMQQDLYYDDADVRQAGGLIYFDAKKEKRAVPVADYLVDKDYLAKTGKAVNNGQYEVDYTAGMISSAKKYKYGLFELRFKSTANKGIWPAFWLFGGEPNEEIDFFELKGERKSQVHVDVHCPDGCENYRGGFLNLKRNWGGWINAKEGLADGWNIISGEWQPGYVKWYLNGQPIAYYKGDFKTAQNLLINSSVAKTGGGFSPGPDETTQWPNHFDVDYVRIWSREDTILSQPKNDYTLFDQSPATVDSTHLYSTMMKKKLNYVYNNDALRDELGSITLLPIGQSKYSISIAGKDPGLVKIEVYNRAREKQMGVSLENMQYYVLNLHDLPTDLYIIEIKAMGHTLRHEIPVIDPKTLPQY